MAQILDDFLADQSKGRRRRLRWPGPTRPASVAPRRRTVWRAVGSVLGPIALVLWVIVEALLKLTWWVVKILAVVFFYLFIFAFIVAATWFTMTAFRANAELSRQGDWDA